LSVLERDGDAAAIGKDRGPGAALGTAFLDNATSILWLGSPAIKFPGSLSRRVGHKLALTAVADPDRPPQGSSVDQNRNDGLRHADQGQHEKLGVVENAEGFHVGGSKSEEQHLNACNGSHQNGLNRIIDPWMRDSQLLGHGHHGSADHENLDPGEMVLSPLHQGCPWIGKDELTGNEENQDISKARDVLEWVALHVELRCSRPAREGAI